MTIVIISIDTELYYVGRLLTIPPILSGRNRVEIANILFISV